MKRAERPAEGDAIASAYNVERGRALDVFVVALAAALVAASLYVARWGYVWYVRREVVGVSRDLGWSAPLATLAIWVPAALVVAPFARFMGRRWALRLAGFAFFTLSALSALIPIGGLARPAVAVLALGIGVSAGRWLATTPRVVRQLRLWSLVAACLLAAAALVFPRLEQRARSARFSAAATSLDSASNVLIIVLDAVRADALGTYGSSRATSPSLDALARDGVVFAQAIATAPWTRPTHRTLFTGEYPRLWPGGESSFLTRMDEDSVPRLAELFQARGYATGAFVANFFYTGWDAGFAHGFARYQDFPRSAEQVLRSSTLGQTKLARSLYDARSWRDVWKALVENDFSVTSRPLNSEKRAATVTDEFLAWHASQSAPRFLAFLNYYDAHLPYDPPAPYDTLFSRSGDPRALYDGAVAYMDAEIGRLLASLEARGVLDETLVIVTSDHGELFGEHGLYEHSSNLYHKLLHVPLILRRPGRVPEGLVVEEVASLRDVAATVADLALPRAAARDRVRLPGQSLATHWVGDARGGGSPTLALVERGVRSDTTLPFTKGDMVSFHDPAWHYIRNFGTGREELYRYRDDPFELRDWWESAPDSLRVRLRTTVDSLVRQHDLRTSTR